METVDYLRVARKRLMILIGLPVLAAVVAAAVVLLTPPRYAVTAYVAAPALVGGVAAQQYTGTQAANQFVAAFAAAATSPKVIDQVSADTRVAPADIRDAVEVKQVGASSQLTLTYTNSDRDAVEPVTNSLTSRALTFLFASQVTVATQQVAAAEADVTAATKGISDWESDNKVSQPDKLYQATLSEQSSLRQQQLSMAAVGNTTGRVRRLRRPGEGPEETRHPGTQTARVRSAARPAGRGHQRPGRGPAGSAGGSRPGRRGRPGRGQQRRGGRRAVQAQRPGPDRPAGGRRRPAHRRPADRAARGPEPADQKRRRE